MSTRPSPSSATRAIKARTLRAQVMRLGADCAAAGDAEAEASLAESAAYLRFAETNLLAEAALTDEKVSP